EDAEALTGATLALTCPLTMPLTRHLIASGLAAVVVPAVPYEVAVMWPWYGPALLVAGGRWYDADAAWAPLPALRWRTVAGGLLVEEEDGTPIDLRHAGAVTRRGPTDDERRDLQLAARVARHVRAHALV